MTKSDHLAAARELPSVLTVDELAALLRINRKTAYESIYRKEIPGIQRIGRQFRICRDTIFRWLAAGGAVTDGEPA